MPITYRKASHDDNLATFKVFLGGTMPQGRGTKRMELLKVFAVKWTVEQVPLGWKGVFFLHRGS